MERHCGFKQPIKILHLTSSSRQLTGRKQTGEAGSRQSDSANQNTSVAPEMLEIWTRKGRH